jgi:hypothetical protein
MGQHHREQSAFERLERGHAAGDMGKQFRNGIDDYVSLARGITEQLIDCLGRDGRQDWGFVVLYNRASPEVRFVDAVGLRVTQLLSGYSPIPWVPSFIPVNLIPFSH